MHFWPGHKVNTKPTSAAVVRQPGASEFQIPHRIRGNLTRHSRRSSGKEKGGLNPGPRDQLRPCRYVYYSNLDYVIRLY